MLHFFVLPALPWGQEGHRVIARVAAAHLSPQAREAISRILGPDTDFVSVSTWADEVRRDRPESGPWHYINIPITAGRSAPTTYCPAEGCVTGRIKSLIQSLKDPATSPSVRRESLKYLIHFIGDMHQPLHAGDRKDRGGNDVNVVFFGQDSNLHRVWDSGILFRMKIPEKELAAALDGKIKASERKKWARGGVDDWIWDSQKASKKTAYGRLTKSSPLRLDEQYQRRAEPVVRVQLAKAGIRLASVLNDIWR